jgi:hypothetical protein
MEDRTNPKDFVMTPEDEEFNRIEMESRVRQEYIKQQRTWVGLTEKEIKYLLSISDNEEDFAYAIEHKLKEKNT